MFRSVLKNSLYRFCNYEASLEKWSSLTSIQKSSWTLNKKITFYGMPVPTDEVFDELSTVLTTHQKQNPSSTVIFLSDCSKNLFVNYKLADQAFREKFYKNITNPEETTAIDKINLEAPDSIKQCYLLSNVFLQDLWTKQKSQAEELEFNQQNIIKLRQKLVNDYDVDPLLSLLAIYALFQNSQSVCFVGISELLIRKMLVEQNSLQVLKQTFVKFAEEIKLMKNEGDNDQASLYYSILFLFEEYFPEILIGKQAQQLFYLLHQLEEDCIILGKTTVQDRLEELFKANTPQIQKQIRQAKSVRKLLSYPKSSEQDEVKIQKHALLQCILQTDLWNKPFIFNKFPYLKQDYLSLQPQQQQTVKQRYMHHLNRYKSAWDKLTS